MKPIKLEFENFGVFKNETIEFSKFDETPLFLISGKTGSGKTTIFDGMTYALYGVSSSGERTPEQLKSDFANNGEATSVTFVFEHNNNQYTITRSPKITYIDKNGKERNKTAKVKLKYIKDDQVIENTKKKEIDVFIQELIGMNAKQFTQVILLPQGKFRDFLTSNSNDKEKLLRDLFDTNFYRSWVENIAKQAKEMYVETQTNSTRIDTLQEQSELEIDEVNVSKWVEQAYLISNNIKRDINKKSNNLKDKNIILLKLQEELANKEQTNKLLDRLAQVKHKQNELSQSSEYFEKLEKLVKQLQELNEYTEVFNEYQVDSDELSIQANKQQELEDKITKSKQKQHEYDIEWNELKQDENTVKCIEEILNNQKEYEAKKDDLVQIKQRIDDSDKEVVEQREIVKVAKDEAEESLLEVEKLFNQTISFIEEEQPNKDIVKRTVVSLQKSNINYTKKYADFIIQGNKMKLLQLDSEKLKDKQAQLNELIPLEMQVDFKKYIMDKTLYVANYKLTLEKLLQSIKENEEEITSYTIENKVVEQDVDRLQTKQKERLKIINKVKEKFELNSIDEMLTKVSQLKDKQNEIQEYQYQVRDNQTLLMELTEQTNGLSRQDVEDLTAEVISIQEVVTKLQTEIVEMETKAANTVKIIDKIDELNAKNQSQLEQLKELNELSNVVQGKNESKLNLERYVLQTYFKQVLEIANLRLNELSKGRYQFVLNDKTGSYQSQTGLEIDILDSYVGKARSSHTLSGGESFIASLCLALALGEVIQLETGKIDVETLFIDEGFGSLDEEALQLALNTLQSVEGKNKMIGIISHVQELKDKIPYQLNVKNNDGISKVDYKEIL